MTKRFRIVYYVLVVLLLAVFSYEMYQLIGVFLEEPNLTTGKMMVEQE